MLIEPLLPDEFDAIQNYPWDEDLIFRTFHVDCATGQITNIALEPGEGEPLFQIYDLDPWMTETTRSRSEATTRYHVRVKPARTSHGCQAPHCHR